MEKQKAVAPTVYEFRVPETQKTERPEPRVINGVEITNRILPKQGITKAVPPPVDSSFLIQNVRKPPAPLGEVAANGDLQEEEEQGFPYDDQADCLFGTPEGAVRKGEPAPAVAPIVFPVSEAPIVEVRRQARAKVQQWVQVKAQQRSRELQQEAAGYKK